VLERDFERDIIPMARMEGKHPSFFFISSVGMALAPWAAVGGGRFMTDAEEERRAKSGENGRSFYDDWRRSEKERKISAALEKVAKEVGTEHITAGKLIGSFPYTRRDVLIRRKRVVALAYVMQKAPYVFPIVGGRKVEQLLGNIEALSISLTREQIAFLESTVDFDIGFPLNFIVSFHTAMVRPC
jgi:aryl-alcohol dehydrogenase-like predicted oxidoreductase